MRFTATVQVGVLSVLALAALWWQSSRLSASQAQFVAVQHEVSEQRRLALRFEWEKEALLEALDRIRSPGPALIGSTGRAGDPPVQIDALGDRLLYIISTKCGNCPRNFPWLKEVEAVSPGAVLGVSLVDDPDTLPAYRDYHQLPFPVLKVTGGWLLDALPRHATPIALVIREDRITRVETGTLSDSVVAIVAKQVVTPFSGRE